MFVRIAIIGVVMNIVLIAIQIWRLQNQHNKSINSTRRMFIYALFLFSLLVALIFFLDPSFLERVNRTNFQEKSTWRNSDLFQFNGKAQKEIIGKFTFWATDTMQVGEQYSVKAAIQNNVSTDLIIPEFVRFSAN